MIIDEAIEQARELRQANELQESLELLLALLEENPDDSVILYEVGGAYDVMGNESEAIPYYQRALELGMEGPDSQECLVSLGSSFRVVGRFQEAVDTLERAVEEFPENNSGRAFLALAYYSNEQYEESVQLLLELLLSTTEDEDILDYADPLDFYKDHLDETWVD